MESFNFFEDLLLGAILALVLVLGQILDPVDQRSCVVTKIIFGVFVHRPVMNRRGVEHRFDIIGQPVSLLSDIFYFVDQSGA
jgi:hypothetical protein